MKTVLEIGCGALAGPKFDDADIHYGLDNNQKQLDHTPNYSVSRGLIFQQGDASSLTDFADSTIDVVLARNLFGVPLLGLNESERQQVRTSERYPGQFITMDKECNKLLSSVDEKKKSFLEAADRVLKSDGQLVVVEQYTPIVAERFFVSQAMRFGSLAITRARLEDVTPENYSSFHLKMDPYTQAWLGVKQSTPTTTR